MTSHPGPAALQDQRQKCVKYLSRRHSTWAGTEGIAPDAGGETLLADVQGEADLGVF